MFLQNTAIEGRTVALAKETRERMHQEQIGDNAAGFDIGDHALEFGAVVIARGSARIDVAGGHDQAALGAITLAVRKLIGDRQIVLSLAGGRDPRIENGALRHGTSFQLDAHLVGLAGRSPGVRWLFHPLLF